MVTLNYSDSYAPTTVLFDKIYMANSCYDPDYSGTGHQPMGFDQWMAIYSRYRVHASYIKITTINKSTTVGNLAQCAVTPSNNDTAASSVQEMAEESEAKESIAGIATGPGEDSILKYATTCAVIGVDSIKNSSEFSGTASANPSTPWYWRVAHSNADGTTLNCVVNVELKQIVEFYAPKYLLQS